MDSRKKTAIMSENEYQGKIELPQFVPEKVILWWAQVETRLALYNITFELNKYKYVSGTLPLDVARQVSDLIITEPSDKPYSKLKSRILEESEPTNAAKLKQLLEDCELGDRKSSVLL